MTDAVIQVKGISKQYRIGLRENAHDSLGEVIMDVLKAPFRNFNRIRSLTNFKESDNSDDVLWALKDVSFEVKKGEVLGLIGKNGAGKSTMLKILSRITKPTQGEAIIDGRVASLLEVGTGFHGELTGRENVYLNGTVLGMKKKEIEKKFDEIVDFSGVEKFIDTPVKRYSSGMTVRLAFAVAAHLNPEILLIDEVLAVGDAEFQKKCLGKMQDISSGEGRTVMFVSHNMDAVKNLCGRSVLIQDGTVIKIGPSDEIIDFYLSEIRKEVSPRSSWDVANAPGNDFAKIISYDIRTQNPTENGTIFMHQSFEIEVHYSLLKSTRIVDVSLHFHNEKGLLLFALGTGFTEDPYSGNNTSGDYKVLFTVPDNQLNAGTYFITLRLVENRANTAPLRLDDFMSFKIEKKINRDMYFNPIGVITPQSTTQKTRL